MGKTRIHFRLSDENYDFLHQFSRLHLGISLNKALDVVLTLAKLAAEEDPEFHRRRPKSPPPQLAQPRNFDDTIDLKLRWAVWERDNFTCKECGARTLLSIDHIKPKYLGGETVIKNLQTLCRNCNSKKGTRPQVASKLDSSHGKS